MEKVSNICLLQFITPLSYQMKMSKGQHLLHTVESQN